MGTERTLEGSFVLVTGGAGFIGSHVVEKLLSAGARVRVLDNFTTGHRDNLKPFSHLIEVQEGDIRDLKSCEKAVTGVDYILHQAAVGSVPRSMIDPSTTIAVNVSGTANVFAAAKSRGINRIVYASSSSVYGDSEKMPKKEGTEGKPLSPYALSKAVCEQLADVYCHCFGMEIVGLRYFNVYGQRQDPNGPYAAAIPLFFNACLLNQRPRIYGNGEQSRDFTFVHDVAEANLKVLQASKITRGAFNVGAGVKTTINELVRIISTLTGYTGPMDYAAPRPGDVLHSLADNSAFQKAYNYKPTTTISEGLAKSFEYYRSILSKV